MDGREQNCPPERGATRALGTAARARKTRVRTEVRGEGPQRKGQVGCPARSRPRSRICAGCINVLSFPTTFTFNALHNPANSSRPPRSTALSISPSGAPDESLIAFQITKKIFLNYLSYFSFFFFFLILSSTRTSYTARSAIGATPLNRIISGGIFLARCARNGRSRFLFFFLVRNPEKETRTKKIRRWHLILATSL